MAKGKRMTAEERRKDLLAHMAEIRKNATKQSEFTASMIAAAAGVTVPWVYKTIGHEFMEERDTLPGTRRSPSLIVAGLRDSNGQIRADAEATMKKLKDENSKEIKKLKDEQLAELTDASDLITRQDLEIRKLRKKVADLESKVNQSVVVVKPQDASKQARKTSKPPTRLPVKRDDRE